MVSVLVAPNPHALLRSSVRAKPYLVRHNYTSCNTRQSRNGSLGKAPRSPRGWRITAGPRKRVLRSGFVLGASDALPRAGTGLRPPGIPCDTLEHRYSVSQKDEVT